MLWAALAVLAAILDAGYYAIVKQFLPSLAEEVLAAATFLSAAAILLLVSVAKGIPPPAPAWGQMCAMGRDYLYGAWWMSTLPGIAIFLVVVSINLLGDWLRFRMDPKFRQI
mgnify:CR=1 FL=1